ncbi:rhamnogalacturonyl hydrolase YesR/beta-xylosidase [Parabacteroides sp. PH5-13]|nr:rhamnogalacturonyl hydrolase YesR/beta-xylosidase [Parabacteroides sp. PH5-39]MDH6318253.1 rhamnogalacturonyl hydrolase YesR/beta-xylosidase [Parabacteroides sp. PH5-13]MDH6321814.1 rhamnogalacturonyl hydrolase YesR/beta-xylosidase [Parabacteroides sp. PH5-8]MDH6383093.1 rhamnogalacturonyl hydrolase YesR/beta-xylosidase [Parabacteroides sp. PH5-17]MDH6392305.1 rhamnogalacturonyl hydrolase YesR/beta-xylosidase [Parabacteroides sp. PFB2-22]MDH6405391.1 rhamnogalacturonyl hydrolase YesR/beta-x
MKNTVKTLLLALLFVSFVARGEEYRMQLTVANPWDFDKTDEPVVLSLREIPLSFVLKSASVWSKDTEIPSQLDDLTADGRYDELAFVLDLPAKSEKQLEVVFSDREGKSYPPRVYAEMLLSDKDGKHQLITSLTVPGSSNIYNLLHHHGPAFESEEVAYRVYFDRKQTVDIYGKFNKGLEIEASQFYPTDEQLARGFGDDVLRVSGSCGLGTLKGWNGTKAIHIEPVKDRTETILASGPVRTITDVTVRDWEYQGSRIDMNVRYILYAGHRDCEVQVSFARPLKSETFAIGIQNIKGSRSFSDSKGLLACWGTDWPVNDTVKYAKETVGLALCLPEGIVQSETQDAANYLYLTKEMPGTTHFNYHINFTSKKETFGYEDREAWFSYVTRWKDRLQKPARLSYAFPHSSAQQAQGNNYVSNVWVADLGNGSYRNPILYADYSDPDVCRVGDDFYMTASSFNCLPGLQILHSKDLVNWSIVGAAIPNALEPLEVPEIPQHGNRIWAPCIRHHEGEFYIFWGDPDQGAFMTKAKSVSGPWSKPVLVKEGKGIIDTSPLWDGDGRVYLVHAYAGSRAGQKSVLAICELSADASKAISESRIIFDGHEKHPTIEGPKLHKRNGYYYIFAPAGGVATGWQTVLRSKDIYGPYEDKIVMTQGKTAVNGPHQGAWVDTESGEDWFIHFQDVGAYGRIVHLQPMKWQKDWPVIGSDKDGDGCGEPVMQHKKPNVGRTYPICTPQESDEFITPSLGLQWQWHANINPKWYFCDAANGHLRLYSYPLRAEAKNLWDVPNLLLQKTPANAFTATMKLRFKPAANYTGERTGLVVMGLDYAGLIIENTDKGLRLSQLSCQKAEAGNSETIHAGADLANDWVYLRATFTLQAVCTFTYSTDGKTYKALGEPFQVREGKWIGAKVGTFCTRPAMTINDGGWAEIDWFRITKGDEQPSEALSYAVRVADSEMARCPESWQLDFQRTLKWDYCHGLELQAFLDLYDFTGDEKYFDYALAYADTMIRADGSIVTYKANEYNIDRINTGKMLFRLYDYTRSEKIRKAIDLLRSQLDTHPRNADGGFWHKDIYPNQVWLDGIYMGTPFLVEYAARYNRPQDFADGINQIRVAARHTYDPSNGLFRHACDVSRRMFWADKETGQSKHSWGRAMGWYAMGIVDALDFIPANEPGRDTVLVILNHLAKEVTKIQDNKTGLWYQVLDKSGAKGNYVESSCSAMFLYALLKGVRMGYLDSSYLDVAEKAYKGYIKHFVEVGNDGLTNITQACAVAGLGGANNRSGDYNYYITELIRANDPKAVGPFIMAMLERERLGLK